MDITRVPDELWKKLLLQKLDCKFEFLGLKFLVVRLQLKVKVDPSESNLLSCIIELREFFKNSAMFPVAHSDFEKILNAGGIK
ncbi:MAG: hypothetical protein V1874_06335 [Spirochaetota bacterium]